MFNKEYFISILYKYNGISSLEDDWKGVFDALIEEQANCILQLLTGNLDSIIARERINAIKWLMNFIEKAKTQYRVAKETLRATDIPQFPKERKE